MSPRHPVGPERVFQDPRGEPAGQGFFGPLGGSPLQETIKFLVHHQPGILA